MRLTPIIAALIAGAAFALPASALTVEAKVSAEFQKKLTKDYGERESEVLTDTLTKRVESTFTSRGIQADRVVVTIEDAKPNRPTFQQVTDKPGLDMMRSISVGGAHVIGVAYNAAGQEIGRLDYDWYETDLGNVIAANTWSDARSTFARFANRFADKLS
jgi:hypothetical protein